MENIEKIKNILTTSASLKMALAKDEKFIAMCLDSVAKIVDCFKRDGKVMFCGNGGSAADAQHLAAEFSGRFYHDRDPLFAEALHANTSYLTAVANDYSFAEVYSRLVKAKCRKGDVLFGISTSGNSENIVRAIEQANQQDVLTIGFTGEKGGKLAELCDICFKVSSNDTPRIQESHIVIGHLICELVEQEYFKISNA
jgi:D-sedoheptulose 7-phosphate isomerase